MKQDLGWADSVLETLQLIHHLFVDLQPASGIHNHHPVAVAFCLLDPRSGDADDILCRSI